MKRLRSDLDLMQIELDRVYLEQAGIEVEVRHEMLSGLMGVLPLDEACPELWVVHDEDFDRADERLKQIEK